VLDTRWCNGSKRGSEPLGLGSNPGWVALEGSAERSASGLENRAGVTPEGSIPLLSAWKMWRVGATSPAKGGQSLAGGSTPPSSAAWVLGHKGGCNPLDFGLAEFDSQTSNSDRLLR